VLRDAQARLLKPLQAGLLDLSRPAIAEALQWLPARADDLAAAFEQELVRQLRRDFGLDTAPSAAPQLAEELKLVDEEQAAEEVELLRAVQVIEGGVDWELRELQARTAMLRGHGVVNARSNPLRPDVFARALWDGAATRGLAGATRRAVLRAASASLARALQQACNDANGWLAEWGIEPAAWKVTPTNDGRSDGPPPSGYDVTQPGTLDRLRVVADRSSPVRGAGRPVVRNRPSSSRVEVQALLAILQGLSRALAPQGHMRPDWLRAHQAKWADAARAAGELDTLQLLSELFWQLSSDRQLAQPVLDRLARLQPVILRAALVDARVFEDPFHPAWQLVNRVASHACGYDDPADPRLATFLESIDRWLGGEWTRQPLESVGDVRLLSLAISALENLCAAHVAAEQSALNTSIERLRRAERAETFAASLRNRLTSEFASFRGTLPLTPTLRDLFLGRWCDAVGEVAGREDENAPLVARLSAFPADLLASLAPAGAAAQRQALLRRLPTLAATLKEGLELTPLSASQRQTVVDELLALHLGGLHSAASRSAPRTEAETPEGIVRALKGELDDGRDEQARLAPASVIDESQLDTLPASLLDGAPGARHTDWLASARPGLWCRVYLAGERRSARIVWMSPSRQHWLMSSAPGRAHLFTASALRRLASEGLLQRLEERNLLQRAVDGWSSGLARRAG